MTESATLTVTGMKCGGCENIVVTKLNSIDGVETAKASSKDKLVNVEFEPSKTNLKEIAQAITAAGYTVVDDN